MLSINYYELLGLPCDGGEANDVKLIGRTLKEWEALKTEARNNESKEAKRRELQAQLDELPKMRMLATDAALRKTHAEDLKAKRIAQVDKIIEIMARGKMTVARAQTEMIARNVGLLPMTVSKRFEEKKLTVVASKPIDVSTFLLEERFMSTLEGDFKLIREHMDRNPNEQLHQICEAENLYEYLAIMQGKTRSEAFEYRRKTAQELCAMFDALAKQHVRNTAPVMYYKSIDSQAKINVFKSEDQRRKYDNAMKLKAVQPLLDLLASVPVTVKLEHAFAENCIREIMGLSFDEDQAIAVYNRYGAMPLDSLYEKESTRITTFCTCHTANYHDTIEQARKAKCSSCGRDLYVPCRKCSKPVPAVADYCECGFFMKGAPLFELHRRGFEEAVKVVDLARAREELGLAELCDPSQSRITSMRRRLKKLDEEVGERIDKIDALLDAGKVNAAQQEIAKLQAERPGIDLKRCQARVGTELAWAAGEYARCRTAAREGDALEICSVIVARVKDYPQALEWLRLHPPKPVMAVQHVGDARRLTCVLQWKDHPDNRYVEYTVVRKENAAPQSISDGEIIATGLKRTECKDEALMPGRVYHYGVFTVRGSAVSKPAHSGKLCLFKGLDDVQVNLSQGVCTLSWNDIPGSRGVQVRRSEDGGKTYSVVASCCRGMYRDTAIVNGKQYRYGLMVVWEAESRFFGSWELERDVRVEQKPPRVDFASCTSGADGSCEVAWNERGNGMLKLVQLNPDVNVVPDRVYSQRVLAGMGSVIATVPLQSARYAWYAEKGKQFRVALFRLFGDDAVAGTTAQISTVSSLKVDAGKSSVSGGVLNVKLEDIPAGVKKVAYLVSSGGETLQERGALDGTAPSIDADQLRRNGGVLAVSPLPQAELTVSLRAVYGTGSGAYCSPATRISISNLPKQRIEYWLEWPTKWLRQVRKGAKLIVRPEGTRIPEMTLCCRENGKMLFNYTPGMPGVKVLATVPASDAEAGEEYEYPLSDAAMKGIPARTDIQLFLAPKEEERFFTPVATNVESRKMPAE